MDVSCTPCPLFSLALLAPPGSPLCVPLCLSRFQRIAASSFRVVLLLLAELSCWHFRAVSAFLGVVWRVLELTQWVGDGSGEGKWCGVGVGGGSGGRRSMM